MKKAVAALIALLFFFMFVSILNSDSNELMGIPKFGEVNLSERVSNKYISKSVSDNSEEVVYGETKDAESGSANMVTSVVVNYRSFDTLGEVTVLFLSATGVAILIGGGKRKKLTISINPIVKIAARIIATLLIVFGAYVFIHGHLTPGGGFPGGTIIAASALLMLIVDDKMRTSKLLKVLEGSMGLLYVVIGVVGLLVTGSFLQNFLPTGTIGNLLSAGIVPIVYSIIGLKVGAELSGLLDDFFAEEGEK
ncbi:cation:proton antiporter [Kosmotoga arenicorallina S304]|uniref:Cation:proton antiporter n=1 Tax=Kosmotoga arenicorallina S304 TaxID=1453497 RepID=A0A176JXH5_9BACT|nr:hydrogen gas-evolving membrane-bound hydrogenase subunit E [Kosmotoga arenicorallina]OAA28426.1 cation:proton antiporter [Kosmotoga arenicorallina S304]